MAINFILTTTFPEVNGLVKEAEMQHTVPFQLSQLTKFWASQHGITFNNKINADNNQKITTISYPSHESRAEFEQHGLNNGVNLKEMISLYQEEIAKLGGELTYVVEYTDGLEKLPDHVGTPLNPPTV
jgi:hypothetical protein